MSFSHGYPVPTGPSGTSRTVRRIDVFWYMLLRLRELPHRMAAGALALGVTMAASPLSASGQERPRSELAVAALSGDTLDLAGALAMARRMGPMQQLVSARRESALGRTREASQWLNPNLEWRRENLGSDLLPDIFATLYLPLDISGRRVALMQAEAAGRSRVNAEAEDARRTAELEVARAWLRAAAAQGAETVLARQAAALREIADVDAKRVQEGVVSEAVGLRTMLEADRAQVAHGAAIADATAARAGLARVLGLPAEELPPIASLRAPSLPTAPDSLTVRTIALVQRPDVKAREAALREAGRRFAAEQRGIFGEVQLQGGTKETSGVMTGQIGIAMPMPLFHRNGGARQRAQGDLMEARVQRDDLLRAVGGAVGAAWRGYVAVRGAGLHAVTFDTRGQEIARIARIAYREGHASLTELLDAERAAADAMQAYLRWASDAWLIRLELERAIGARLDADGPLDLPLLNTLRPTGNDE